MRDENNNKCRYVYKIEIFERSANWSAGMKPIADYRASAQLGTGKQAPGERNVIDMVSEIFEYLSDNIW